MTSSNDQPVATSPKSGENGIELGMSDKELPHELPIPEKSLGRPSILLLPAELAILIFHYVLSHVDNATREYARIVARLRSVHPTWAALIANTAQFWTGLRSTDREELVEVSLARSASHTLDVFINCSIKDWDYRRPDEYNYYEFYPRIAPTRNRWRTLSFDDVEDAGSLLREVLSHPFENLEALWVRLDSPTADTIDYMILNLFAPKLQVLSLDSCSIDWDSCGLSNLTYVELKNVESSLVGLLTTLVRCRDLAELRIQDCGSEAIEDTPPLSWPPVRLERLHTLLCDGDGNRAIYELLQLIVPSSHLRSIHVHTSGWVGEDYASRMFKALSHWLAALPETADVPDVYCYIYYDVLAIRIGTNVLISVDSDGDDAWDESDGVLSWLEPFHFIPQQTPL